MKTKIKILLAFILLLATVLILFSIFYKIQTFYVGSLIEYNGNQIVQLQKTKDTNFYKNKQIYLKANNITYSAKIIALQEDANYYYLTLSQYFYDYKDIKNI